MKSLILSIAVFFIVNKLQAQAGISVSPGRLYYKAGIGATNSQFISLTNPTDRELEVGVSFSDWEYEPSGNNKIAESGTLKTSCVDWIQVLPASYFLLKPGETKEVEVRMKVPSNADTNVAVHTAMIFFTQLNPGKASDQNGAAIQVTVRMGVKIYHSFFQKNETKLEFADFTSYSDEQNNKFLELHIENIGNVWTDGKIKWELFNNNTGNKTIIKESDFYTLPKDVRVIKQQLPSTLQKGQYTVSAILTYGENDIIKIAELEFNL